jgi:5'-nucleotidase
VNIPDVAFAEIRGIRTVRLGKRHQAEPVEKVSSVDGREQWRIGAVGPAADAGPDTDFGATAEGFVSVTPLSVDLTQYSQLRAVSSWLGTNGA